ncbi:UNKNOWN [Stylonychia lemnae]|uniref:Dynein heavy chain tail domain-containing protein n=1 Tax=Stylonychia lemnae TaxID=5949 RepID=A0A078AE52_STYLE|nr:UNKNOWN [Stylonychia lemnae]|eukprot:CDW80534.1 UNKNOWN [Stylonychia lemnae]
MRSKKTSRYKSQHPDSDEDDYISQFFQRYEQKVHPALNLLFAEKGSELILIYLDNYEVQKIGMVSQAWYNQVNSYTLFTTILKSMKEVVDEESKEKDTKQVKNKQKEILDENQEFTSSRQISGLKRGGQSKFSQRFNMMGTNQQISERQMTPSTTSSEVSVDENQWIKRPPLQSIYDPSKAADPLDLFNKLSQRELGTIHDYINLWNRNIQTLLDKLRDTIPGEGMIGEVHYWRDMARILEAINGELKQNYVEISIQILANSKDKSIIESLEKFSKEKNRVLAGAKEARWNNKYMKVIEKPVQSIERSQELKEIQLVIVVLLKSLKNIYENSNFYKEARINFWIVNLMRESKEMYFGDEKKQINEQSQMNQSYYSKQGLDFLYFARPGTAYGAQAFQNASLGMTQTMSGFYDGKSQTVKPIEMIKSKSQNNQSRLVTQMWFERAQKILNQLEHLQKLFEFFSYSSLIANRIAQEYVPELRNEKDKFLRLKKNEFIKELKQFLELYSAYQLEYDYFDHKNITTFSYFIEKFETKAQELEGKFNRICNGQMENEETKEDYNQKNNSREKQSKSYPLSGAIAVSGRQDNEKNSKVKQIQQQEKHADFQYEDPVNNNIEDDQFESPFMCSASWKIS